MHLQVIIILLEYRKAGYSNSSMISNHFHPNHRLHRWIGWMARAAMFGTVLATFGLMLGAVAYSAGLLLVMIPFLWGLSVPLFLLTSLYPSVIVYEDGIEVKPYGFSASRLSWDDILATTQHTLLKPPPPSKLKRVAQSGVMIVVKPTSLPFHYRMVGLMAGAGWKPIFAISNKTHTDYEDLLAIFESHVPHREWNDV